MVNRTVRGWAVQKGRSLTREKRGTVSLKDHPDWGTMGTTIHHPFGVVVGSLGVWGVVGLQALGVLRVPGAQGLQDAQGVIRVPSILEVLTILKIQGTLRVPVAGQLGRNTLPRRPLQQLVSSWRCRSEGKRGLAHMHRFMCILTGECGESKVANADDTLSARGVPHSKT